MHEKLSEGLGPSKTHASLRSYKSSENIETLYVTNLLEAATFSI